MSLIKDKRIPLKKISEDTWICPICRLMYCSGDLKDPKTRFCGECFVKDRLELKKVKI